MKIFNFLKPKKPEEVIAVGSKWVLDTREKGDPWPLPPSSHLVTVIDVKGGWVRYDMGRYSPFRDERRKKESFLRMYSKIEERQKCQMKQ